MIHSLYIGLENRLKYGVVHFHTCFTIFALMMRKPDGLSSREGFKAIVDPANSMSYKRYTIDAFPWLLYQSRGHSTKYG